MSHIRRDGVSLYLVWYATNTSDSHDSGSERCLENFFTANTASLPVAPLRYASQYRSAVVWNLCKSNRLSDKESNCVFIAAISSFVEQTCDVGKIHIWIFNGVSEILQIYVLENVLKNSIVFLIIGSPPYTHRIYQPM